MRKQAKWWPRPSGRKLLGAVALLGRIRYFLGLRRLRRSALQPLLANVVELVRFLVADRFFGKRARGF